MKSVLLPLVPVRMRPCVGPPKMESLFYLVLWSFCSQALLVFKAKCSGDPKVGELDVVLRTLTPLGEPL